MALTANPFHPTTGELLPTYRDAYLRGDLSGHNAALVDAYLKQNTRQNATTFERLHALQADGHAVRPVGWVQQQLGLLRTQPQRIRQRAGALVLFGALVAGAALAGNHSGGSVGGSAPAAAPTTVAGAGESAAEAAVATVRISGRILGEDGQPLVGATVIDKVAHQGVSTDAQGRYSLLVSRRQATQLQFGYGGYQEEELTVRGQAPATVTLVPRDGQAPRTWWQRLVHRRG